MDVGDHEEVMIGIKSPEFAVGNENNLKGACVWMADAG